MNIHVAALILNLLIILTYFHRFYRPIIADLVSTMERCL